MDIYDTLVTALGYVEETDPWKLESRFFPSKVGGKPAWLDLLNLPNNEDLKCPKCQNPCMFLCQVYAPWNDFEYCFHRTIFIFLCVDPECCEENENRTFKVFRCQFGRKNNFYPYEPPPIDKNWRPDLTADMYHKLCIVCGAKGTSHCGRCKSVNYCSRQHQIVDWKTGHKELCRSGTCQPESNSMRCLWLLPEFELVTGREDVDNDEGSCSAGNCSNGDDDDEDDDENDNDDDEKKRLEEFKTLVQQGRAGTLQDTALVNSDLSQMASGDEDREFVKFRARIAKFPEQVLRYERYGSPLWLTSDNTPKENDIPPCPYCQSPRKFELQVMPQMLNHLALDGVGKSVDWGVLAVYTCAQSCDQGPAYKHEFLWKQDIEQCQLQSHAATLTRSHTHSNIINNNNNNAASSAASAASTANTTNSTDN